MGGMRQPRVVQSLTKCYLFLNVIFSVGETAEDNACNIGIRGAMYMGSLNKTTTGKACQPWASDSPHEVATQIADEHFPDGSKAAAKNFCRNPQRLGHRTTWCYTMNPDVEWELCDTCSNDRKFYSGCSLEDKGASYKGKLAHTQTLRECLPWDKHPNVSYKFPDKNKKQSSNFCRNPYPAMYDAPWCFVDGMQDETWDYCDICLPFLGSVTSAVGRITQGTFLLDEKVSHLACLHFCITMVLCLEVSYEKTEKVCRFQVNRKAEIETHELNPAQWETHIVNRVCPSPAEGKDIYFIEFIKLQNGIEPESPVFLNDAQREDCDEECLKISDCQYYELYLETGVCRSVNSAFMRLAYANEHVIARVPVRCNPSLRPAADVLLEYNKINPGDNRQLQAAVDDPMKAAADDPIKAIEKLESSHPPNKSYITVAVVIGVLLTIVGGGVVFFLHRKGKDENEENDEGKDNDNNNGHEGGRSSKDKGSKSKKKRKKRERKKIG